MSFDQPNSGDQPDQPRNEPSGDNPPGADQAQTPYGQQADPYGQQPDPYGQQQSPYGQQPSPYGQQPSAFGQQQGSYGQQPPAGQQDPYDQQGAFGQPSASQPSASQPSASQPSASQPSASQPSASQQAPGEQQPWGNQPAQGQPGGWGGGQGDWGQQGQQGQGQNPWDAGSPTQNPWDQNQATAGVPAGYGPPQQGTAGGQIKEANPLKAMFDFSFNTFATPGLVKLVYILAMVLGVLYWLGMIIGGFASGAVSAGFGGDFNPVLGILAIIFGWIPAFFWILLIRIGLEFALATVRSSEDIRHIRANANAND